MGTNTVIELDMSNNRRTLNRQETLAEQPQLMILIKQGNILVTCAGNEVVLNVVNVCKK